MVFWISLAIFAVAIIAGLAFCVIRGYQFYRQAKGSGAKITAEMDRISAVMAEIERHTAKAEAASERLKAATGRLAVTRARLNVQLAAIREARAQVRRTFWFVPGI